MRPYVVLVLAGGCGGETGVSRILEPPKVSIQAPSPQERIRLGGEPIVFMGTATDSFDLAPSMLLWWYLDEDTRFPPSTVGGDGVVTLDFDPTDVALGEHLLQLEATDRDGQQALSGVRFVLDGALSGPTVEITAPASGALFPPGKEITFRGQAEDNNTDPADLEFAWRSDVDGPLTGAISGDGQSVLFYDALSQGPHEISLEATDVDGEVGIDTIQVSIGDIVTPAEPGDLVFSELMINPQVVDDDVGEWLEFYNAAPYAVDVGGYTLRDEDFDNFTIEGPLLVAPGDYVVLCADPDAGINGGVPCDGPFRRQASGAVALGNSGDEVILARPDGVVIDEVVYSRSWYSAGVAIGVDPDELSADNNDAESDWCDQSTVISTGGEPGTPGRENDDC